MASNNKKLVSETKAWISSPFDMKDMGEAAYVLGVKILQDRSRWTLGLSQETYVRKILERFNVSKAKPIDTPVIKNHGLSLKDYPKTLADKAKMASMLCECNRQSDVRNGVYLTRSRVCHGHA